MGARSWFPARIVPVAGLVPVLALSLNAPGQAVRISPLQAGRMALSGNGRGITGYLNAVAGQPKSTWAAGWYRESSGADAPWFLRRSGTSWRAVRGVAIGRYDTITGIGPAGPDDAWAVGAYMRPGSGKGWLTLTEHWNGTRWARVPSPDPGVFFKVRPSNVLSAVAAVSPRDVWAVGSWSQPALPFWENTRAILLHYNGRLWRTLIAPDPLGLPHDYALDAIVARSARDIWVAGGYPTTPSTGKLLIEHYNGRRWSIVTAPSPGISAGISSLSLGTGDAVWAVGSYNVVNSAGTVVTTRTLILRWNGSAWRRVPSPNPSASFNVLTGVSAVPGGGAWAVGKYNTSSPGASPVTPDRTLTLRWARGRWHAVASPDPGNAGNFLYGVLDNRTGTYAVGEADSGPASSLTVRPILIRWTGTRWQPQTVAAP